MGDADETGSTASDFSVLMDATEAESLALSPPYLAGRTGEGPHSYNQVEFIGIWASYSVNSDLCIQFRYSDDLPPSVTDRLALYRVGFTSPQHYLMYEWAPRQPNVKKEEKDGEEAPPPTYEVKFDKSRLPRDASEFFQVCFISDEQTIHGVSAPFQLLSNTDGDLTYDTHSEKEVHSMDQTDGSVLVLANANSSMMRECMQRVQEDKVAVDEQLCSVREQLLQQAKDNLQLKEQLHGAESKCEELETRALTVTGENEKLKNSMQLMQEQMIAAADMAGELRVSAAKQEVANQALKLKVEQANVDFQIRESEFKQGLRVENNRVQALDEKMKLMSGEMQQCHQELEEARLEVQFWTQTATEDKTNIHSMSEKFVAANEEIICQLEKMQKQNSELASKDDTIEVLQQKLHDFVTQHDVLCEETKELRQQLQVYECRVSVLDRGHGAMRSELVEANRKIDSFKEQVVSCTDERDGAERVAEQLSQRQLDLDQAHLKLKHAKKTLKNKCSRLSEVIRVHNGSAVEDKHILLKEEDQKIIMDVYSDTDSESDETVSIFKNTAEIAITKEVSATIEDSRVETEAAAIPVTTVTASTTDEVTNSITDETPVLGKNTEIPAVTAVEQPAVEQPAVEHPAVEQTDVEQQAVEQTDVEQQAVSALKTNHTHTSLASLEVASNMSSSVDGRMLEELLGHVKELKVMMVSRPNPDINQEATTTDAPKTPAESETIDKMIEKAPLDENTANEEEEETEIFLDATTLPTTGTSTASTVINIECEAEQMHEERPKGEKPHEEKPTGEQGDGKLPKVENEQEKSRQPPPQEEQQQQQQQPWASYQFQGSHTGGYPGFNGGFSYCSPVFTAGQTAPVFFSQSGTNSRSSSNCNVNNNVPGMSTSNCYAAASHQTSAPGSASPNAAIPLPFPPAFPGPCPGYFQRSRQGATHPPPPPPPPHGMHPPPPPPHGMHPPPPPHGMHPPPPPHGMHPPPPPPPPMPLHCVYPLPPPMPPHGMHPPMPPHGIHPPMPPHGMHPPMPPHGIHPPAPPMPPHGMHPPMPPHGMHPPMPPHGMHPPMPAQGIYAAPTMQTHANVPHPFVRQQNNVGMTPPAPPTAEADTESSAGGLPPPLLPERTDSARHAALLSTIGAAAATAIQSLGATASMAPVVANAAVMAANTAAMAANTAVISVADAVIAAQSGQNDVHQQSDVDTEPTEILNENEDCDAGASSNANNNEQQANEGSGHPSTNSWAHVENENGDYECNDAEDTVNVFPGQGFISGLMQRWGSQQQGYVQQHQQHMQQHQQHMQRHQQHMQHHNQRLQQHHQQMHNVRGQHENNADQVRQLQMRCRQQMRSSMIERMRAHRQMANVAATTRATAASSGRTQDPKKLFSDCSNDEDDANVPDCTGTSNGGTTECASEVFPQMDDAPVSVAVAAEEDAPTALTEAEEATIDASSEDDAADFRVPTTVTDLTADPHLHCPLCQLKFGPSSVGLLEQHVESHLEFICPVCNVAFQRSNIDMFTMHVNSHFHESDDTPAPTASAPYSVDVDPSGPWSGGFMETD